MTALRDATTPKRIADGEAVSVRVNDVGMPFFGAIA